MVGIRVLAVAVLALAVALAGCGTVPAGLPGASPGRVSPSPASTYRVNYGFSGD